MNEETAPAGVMSCGSCYYRRGLQGDPVFGAKGQEGRCHRAPPVIAFTDLAAPSRGIFPVVKASWWCGEWRAMGSAA